MILLRRSFFQSFGWLLHTLIFHIHNAHCTTNFTSVESKVQGKIYIKSWSAKYYNQKCWERDELRTISTYLGYLKTLLTIIKFVIYVPQPTCIIHSQCFLWLCYEHAACCKLNILPVFEKSSIFSGDIWCDWFDYPSPHSINGCNLLKRITDYAWK